MRGGTSKGPCFDMRDLPKDAAERDKVLLRLMGSPSKGQIDGIGGAQFVTSKVVIVQPSKKPGIDVDYLFAQVFIEDAIVDIKPTCGNMMSCVAPFAIEKGWVNVKEGETTVKVFMMNTNSVAEMVVKTNNGEVNYIDGDCAIDGIAGTGAPILMRMTDPAGGATGKLFPTGNGLDVIDGKSISLVDAGNLMIHFNAAEFNVKGTEDQAYFNEHPQILESMESIRRKVALQVGLGDVANSVLPKISLLSKPKQDGHIRSQYFTPKTLHPTHAVSGAVCVAAALKCKGTLASTIGYLNNVENNTIKVEHSCGNIPIELITEGEGDLFKIISAGTIRTARKLMDGWVFY